MAFTTLAFGELVHMACVSTGDKSIFTVFTHRNKMMILAFAAGVLLQLAVILVPGISDMFATTRLSLSEWGITILCTLAPFMYHEIRAVYHKLKKRRGKVAE